MDEAQQLALLFVSISGLQTARSTRRRGSLGRIAILAKTNREQSLIVHALFGKQKVMSSGKADGGDHCP